MSGHLPSLVGPQGGGEGEVNLDEDDFWLFSRSRNHIAVWGEGAVVGNPGGALSTPLPLTIQEWQRTMLGPRFLHWPHTNHLSKSLITGWALKQKQSPQEKPKANKREREKKNRQWLCHKRCPILWAPIAKHGPSSMCSILRGRTMVPPCQITWQHGQLHKNSRMISLVPDEMTSF